MSSIEKERRGFKSETLNFGDHLFNQLDNSDSFASPDYTLILDLCTYIFRFYFYYILYKLYSMD